MDVARNNGCDRRGNTCVFNNTALVPIKLAWCAVALASKAVASHEPLLVSSSFPAATSQTMEGRDTPPWLMQIMGTSVPLQSGIPTDR